MAAVGYRRESSVGADVDQAYAHQEERLRAYGCLWIFGDRLSGRRNDRAGYQKALNLIRTGEADELVVTHLFRLGRSVVECMKTIDLIKSKGAKLTILGGQVNTETPEGRAYLSMQMVIGQLEAELGQERQKMGWLNSIEKGRPRTWIFGYSIVNGLYVPNPELAPTTMAIVDKMLELRSLSATLKWIWAEYGEEMRSEAKHHTYPPSTVRSLGRWLVNPILRGHLFLGGKKFYNRHVPIVSEEQVDEIKAIIEQNRGSHGYHACGKKRYPYSGILRCEACGGSCTYSFAKQSKKTKVNLIYYRCERRMRGLCDRPTRVRVEKIEAAVIEAIVSAKERIAELLSTKGEAEEPIEVRELRDRIAQLTPIAVDPRIKALIQEMEVDIKNLLAQVSFEPAVNQREKIELLNGIVPELFGLMDDEEKRIVVQALVRRIVLLDREVRLVELRV
jgi:DNA invertase Pin-like site-specific DNA recombinase